MVKCQATKGLLLHVDAPVKQIILDLDAKNNNAIVLYHLQSDENKLPIVSYHLQSDAIKVTPARFISVDSGSPGKLDSHLESITFEPDGVART
ncbi:hypothetical protein T484DRAFT_1763740 [Baffinella frigidus]|nr:hypothetical protein T484DRAFT_1763740 [Cryptophyta sp. CCMP2293]